MFFPVLDCTKKDDGSGWFGTSLFEGNSKNITSSDIHGLQDRLESLRDDSINKEQLALLANVGGDNVSRDDLKHARDEQNPNSREYALYNDLIEQYDNLRDRDTTDFMSYDVIGTDSNGHPIHQLRWHNSGEITDDDIAEAGKETALDFWNTSV